MFFWRWGQAWSKAVVRYKIQEIWTNAHKTRDSISLISYEGCLGLPEVISVKIHIKCALQPKIGKNSLKIVFLGFKVVQGHRCWYHRKAPQQRLLWYAVFICNRSRARLVDSSRNCAFWRGTQIWCIRMEDSLNLGGQTLHRLHKSTFNAEHFICRLSWPISNGFGAIHS